MSTRALTPNGLRELGGPEAIGGDWGRFFELLWRVTKTEWMTRYQGSVLGYAWTLLGPLLFALVLYFAFSRVVRFGGDIQHYQVVLILDITVFSAFTDGIGKGLTCLISKGAILRNIEVPRLVFPVAAVAVSMITLCLNMIVVLGLALILGVSPTLEWLLLPVVILALIVVAIPTATLLSVVNARFRDVSLAWTAIARALFFASPVIIPIERYPESWHAVLQWNPLAVILAQGRVWIVDPSAMTWGEAVGGWQYIVCPIAVTVLIGILAVWAFRTQVGRVAEQL
jgi:ABC-2 type transport system permease protein